MERNKNPASEQLLLFDEKQASKLWLWLLKTSLPNSDYQLLKTISNQTTNETKR